MISLLTEELNNFDYNNQNQININKISNNHFEKNIENFIENKIKTKSMSIKEYSLCINSFDPTKNSPPNEWQFRLIKRINSLNYLNKYN